MPGWIIIIIIIIIDRSIGIAHSTVFGFNRNDQHNVAATGPSHSSVCVVGGGGPGRFTSDFSAKPKPKPSHTPDQTLHFSEEEKVGSPEETTLFCALDADADEDGRC